MVDHVGIIVLLVVGVLAPLVGVFALRSRSMGSGRNASSLEAERAPEDRMVGLPLLAGVLVYLLVQTLALLLVLWALAFHAGGWSSLALLLIPAAIGGVHAWWVGAFKW